MISVHKTVVIAEGDVSIYDESQMLVVKREAGYEKQVLYINLTEEEQRIKIRPDGECLILSQNHAVLEKGRADSDTILAVGNKGYAMVKQSKPI